MIDIENTQGMSDYLKSADADTVRFPANSNIVLANCGIKLQDDRVADLEEIASKAGRCLHLC